LEFSFHSLTLLFGFVVAGLSMAGAIAVGPFGWHGARVGLAMVSVAAFLVSVFWSLSYIGYLDQRRAIEARLAELRGQALASGSALACLERGGEALEAACGETLFRTPETLAAANFYTASRLDVLRAADRYAGPRSEPFEESIAVLKRSLEQDPFGLTAHVLTVRDGCTEERCDSLALLQDGARVKDNIRHKAFDANLARHAAAWRTGLPAAPPVASAAPSPAPASTATASVPAVPALTPTGETRAPIPDKYTLPSSASIPPVSIMSDEPARPAAQAKEQPREQAKDRQPAERPATAAAPPAPSADADPPPAHAAPAQPAAQKQAPRRETVRPSAPNAPLSITPGQ
jgi:hypothetical protein